ncbi:hypothetical protein [Mycolicibacterium aubagnense]|uniref:Uncharacterized protein n=1 Tax=Mycolicibacterium aubagnense TaxID=319707 RepID=A0ABN5Z1Z7_9MYCO|nr:hypothetical protein [Mycolicibacterium aubagnense]TLH62354.1 hypothetical protein C1S80_15220 [Mycolicibacterium aubagnense]BBX88202.1 hypothetical protein MAUB_64030 [Mycolicibacterium aubagnense]
MTANATGTQAHVITIAIDEIDDLPDELVENPPPTTAAGRPNVWRTWRSVVGNPQLRRVLFRDLIKPALLSTLAAAFTVELARHTVQLAATMGTVDTHANPGHTVIRAAASVALSSRALLTALTHTNAPATLLIVVVVTGLIRALMSGEFSAAQAIRSTARLIMPVSFSLDLITLSANLTLPTAVWAAPWLAYIAMFAILLAPCVINARRVTLYGTDAVLMPWTGVR